MHLSSFLLFPITLIATAGAVPSTSRCRCRPLDTCWPSSAEWANLNKTVEGNLVAVRPFASVCHDPTFNDAACTSVTNQSTNSIFLAENPGALQMANWGARPATNETCYIGTARSVPCGQGRISLYSVVARRAEHIQAGVRFAARHNIRLVIKNSGHCYLGRSSAPESLQILTHFLDTMDFVDDFKPKGCGKGVKGEGSAVTLGAGVGAKNVYTALGEKNLIAVIGLAHTVGPVGGYIQGSGHSPLGWFGGLAADNALEFMVVNSKGELVAANAYQNTDLFWALRGGGGGTFGVVVSVTIRTFPEIPVWVQSIAISTLNTTAFWAAMQEWNAALPGLNDAGASGYYWIRGSETSASTLLSALFFANQTDETVVSAAVDPLLSKLTSLLGNTSVMPLRSLQPQSKDLWAQLLKGDADETGGISRVGSRLVSHDFLSKADGPAKLNNATKEIVARQPGITVIGHIVAGGKVAANKGIDSAVNPAWRRTVTHLVGGGGWSVNATVEEIRVYERKITDVLLPYWKNLEPDMGAYLNEADADEKDFQQSFWGKNYKKLYQVKQKLDPEGLFIVRRGVGSEDWDDDGLCRVGRY